MTIPSWAKSFIKEMIPELIAEFISLQGIKKLLHKGREKADSDATGSKNDSSESVKHGGMFNLSDEEAYFRLLSGLSTENSKKISKFLNSKLEPWQCRRFRASVGNLGEITISPKSEWKTFKKSESVTEATQKSPKKTHATFEQKEVKSGGGSINVGVKFLENFAMCSEDEMLDICKAAGIMHSDLEVIKQTWKKMKDWAEDQGPELIKRMDSLKESIQEKSKSRNRASVRFASLKRFFGICCTTNRTKATTEGDTI